MNEYKKLLGKAAKRVAKIKHEVSIPGGKVSDKAKARLEKDKIR